MTAPAAAWLVLAWLLCWNRAVAVQRASLHHLGAASDAPTVVLLPASPEEAEQSFERWREPLAGRGWTVVLLAGRKALAPADAAVQAVEGTLEEARRQGAGDPARTYLIGEGEGASAVFYLVSRRPDLWAAAVAVGGSPRAAIQSNRLFAANTQLAPVLWIPRPHDPAAAAFGKQLRDAGYNLVTPSGPAPAAGQVLDWLAAQRREPFPSKVDCETGHPAFARCYWAELTRLDFSLRNDVLPSSRVPPGSGASLDLGGFGFDPEAPGPGLLVGWLPENYQGPLRLGDRLVAVAGKEIPQARAYLEFMERQGEGRRVAVMILRGSERLRLETRILVPKREELLTARFQGEFLPESREVQLVSRGVAALRLRLPQFWTPARISWNGLEAGAADRPGCWEITQGAPARPCPP